MQSARNEQLTQQNNCRLARCKSKRSFILNSSSTTDNSTMRENRKEMKKKSNSKLDEQRQKERERERMQSFEFEFDFKLQMLDFESLS